MSTIPSNSFASSGARVMSVCFASGSAECILCNFSGRRKPRTNEVRLADLSEESCSTGIEGIYLKLGKRNADAVDELLFVAGAMEEAVTRTLLKG